MGVLDNVSSRPVPIEESAADTFNIRTDWKEIASAFRPGGGGALSSRTSEDQITIEVPFNKLRSLYRALFGWSIAQDGSPWLLQRKQIPLQHPWMPWLWADACTVTPYNPLANPDVSQNKAKLLATVPNTNMPPYTMNWKKAEVAVRFKPLHAPLAADTPTGNMPQWFVPGTTPEWRRNLGIVTAKSKLEILSGGTGTTANTLWFAEGKTGAPDGPTPGGPSVPGTAIPGGLTYTRKFTTEFNLLWTQVEESYVVKQTLNGYHTIPVMARLNAYLGYVNSTEFCGAPAGTLLFVGFDPGERYQQPVRTETPFGLWAYDIMLNFAYFNPPRAPSVTTVPGGSTPLKLGWHLYPNKTDSNWYFATKGSNAGKYTGIAQLKEADFSLMFTHVSNNTVPYPT